MQEAMQGIAKALTSLPQSIERRFLERGLHAMQRISGQPRYDTDIFVITSLEVIVDKDRRLGCGGFGEVYEGDWHGTRVAVKVLDKGLPESVSAIFIPGTQSSQSLPWL